MSKRAPPVHKRPFDLIVGNAPVKQALRQLGALGSMPAQLAVFDGRATRYQLIHWRVGRRRVPAWAIDLLEQKINARSAALKAPLDQLRDATRVASDALPAGRRGRD